MDNFVLVNISLKREFDDFIQNSFYDFDNIGFEVDDPVEKARLLSELPEWEISDMELEDKGLINYGIYFEDSKEGWEEAKRFIGFFEETFPGTSYSLKLIDNSNWEDEWKKSYKGFEIGNRIFIKPSWEEVPDTDRIVIEIDPKMAFGTGTHETTSLCMRGVENWDLRGKDILDIGCGSGILSILAKKMGAGRVLACDIDDLAVKSASENSKINACGDIEVRYSDLFSNVDGKFDVIFANILAEVLVKMIGEAGFYLKEEGKLVLSGIIDRRLDMVKNALKEANFAVIDIKSDNEWNLLIAERKYV